MYKNNGLQIEYKGKVLENVKYLGVTVIAIEVVMFNPLLDKGMKAVKYLLSKSKDMRFGSQYFMQVIYINHYSLLIVWKSDLGKGKEI